MLSKKMVAVYDAIQDFIEKNPKCSPSQIVFGTKLPAKQIKNAIRHLKSKGCIEFEGHGRGVKYQIKGAKQVKE